MALQLVVSLVCYVATFSFSALLFYFFNPSGHDYTLNVFFIVMTLIIDIAFTVIAMHPQVNGSILPASVVSVYSTYLCYGDFQVNPRTTNAIVFMTSVLGRLPVLTTLIFSTAVMSCITGILATVKDLPDVEGDRLYSIKLLSISQDRKRVFWTCIYTTRHVLCCYGGGSYFFICLDQRRNH
eukprot:Gb_19089 [translate_table: standard]